MASAKAVGHAAIVFAAITLGLADCAFGPSASPAPVIVSDWPIPNPRAQSAAVKSRAAHEERRAKLLENIKKIQDEISNLSDDINSRRDEIRGRETSR